ncbi:putative OB-fold protein [Streptomyces sp. V4I23]|uniref:zinc ribbon domain-containing protein n=1 Tax=Streptomyces sp. V4I23 TaxID=3042282 RepID=UPI00278B2B11|nr:zinc ribbon domain-containing protein [Streptomyces sp. V4I23]MDQ1012127.1 putative OB-fold protein [Streptomyces sp. V4I23]
MFYARVRHPANPQVKRVGDTDGLFFQRCAWCGTTTFRRLLCPVCRSSDLTPARSAGEGTVLPRRAVTPGTEDLWPVRMTEGFVVRCRVEGPLHAIRPGVRVRLCAPDSENARTDDRVDRLVPVVRLCDAVPLDGWI